MEQKKLCSNYVCYYHYTYQRITLELLWRHLLGSIIASLPPFFNNFFFKVSLTYMLPSLYLAKTKPRGQGPRKQLVALAAFIIRQKGTYSHWYKTSQEKGRVSSKVAKHLFKIRSKIYGKLKLDGQTDIVKYKAEVHC